MATDLERLVVQLSADIKKFENAFNRAAGLSSRQMSAIERRAAQMSQRVERLMNGVSFHGLNAALASVGAALGVREIAAYADEWTRAGNLIRSAATAANVEARSLDQLKDGANEARTGLSDYVDLYARLIRSASSVAQSEQEIALATNIVAKAFKAGGAGAQEQAAGILQLGQALGSGVLQGDELRSLRENAPILAEAIADEFKTTIAGLKQLGADGKLTSDRVFRAIINAQKPIEAQFKATNTTISDAITQVNNEFLAYIGNADASAGASARLVEALQFLADNFRGVADVVVSFATILITALTGRAIAGMVVGIGNAVAALGSFLTAVRAGTAVAVSFSTALGPIGLLAGAAAGAVLLLYNNMSSGDDAARSFNDAIKGNETALNNAAGASRNYQAELVKQISLQLQAAEAAYTQANAEANAANARARAFREMTGLRFAPLEYDDVQKDQTAVALGAAVAELRKQKEEAEKILASTPSGYGSGTGTSPDDGKSKRKRPNEYQREIQQITDRTAALVAETEVRRQLNPVIDDYDYAVEKAQATQELLNAAQKAGVEITPKLRAEIEQTAEQWAVATAEANKLAEAQGNIREKMEDWRDTGKDATRGIVDDLIDGKSAAEAFAGALDKVLSKLLDMALDGIFGTSGSGNWFASFFGSLVGKKDGGVVKAASGGFVRGPGGPRTDSIPARLSDGEYVVNAAATKKNRALLDAINSGNIAAFADGGPVMRAPTMPILRAPSQSQQGAAGIHVDVGVTVDQNGNLQAFVKNVSRQESRREIKAYDKTGPVRLQRDSRKAKTWGVV